MPFTDGSRESVQVVVRLALIHILLGIFLYIPAYLAWPNDKDDTVWRKVIFTFGAMAFTANLAVVLSISLVIGFIYLVYSIEILTSMITQKLETFFDTYEIVAFRKKEE